jgi:hypothetical protein
MPQRDFRSLIQLDLFRARPKTREWERLPVDVRCQTVSLLARLLNARRQARVVADHGREVGDE